MLRMFQEVSKWYFYFGVIPKEGSESAVELEYSQG